MNALSNLRNSGLTVTVLVGLVLIPPDVDAQSLTCNEEGSNLGCIAGCIDCSDVEGGCAAPAAGTGVANAQNFFPVDLALVQAPKPPAETTRFLEGCKNVFAKKGVPAGRIKTVANLTEAIMEIMTLSGPMGLNRPIDVVICGHGSSGSIKVGSTFLKQGATLKTFVDGVKGKIRRLVLFGCKVAAGPDGQKLVRELSKRLNNIPVKAWTSTVLAYTNVDPHPSWEGERLGKLFYMLPGEKKDIPTVSEWGVVVMVLVLLVGGTIVSAGVRKGRSAAA